MKPLASKQNHQIFGKYIAIINILAMWNFTFDRGNEDEKKKKKRNAFIVLGKYSFAEKFTSNSQLILINLIWK